MDSLASLGRRLLAWYRDNRRDLPWRRVHDPYAIWIAEVMLQQTTVATATPYWERFLDAFPTLDDLSAAPLESVLRVWSGLGYYQRARNLHRAARAIASRGERGLPETVEELRALPGIGRYTAAAIASVAFGAPVAVVDGNVQRVLSRLAGFTADPRRAGAARAIEAMAQDLLEPSSPGDSNQALMELGATVCSPRNPRCAKCPLAPACVASRRGDPEQFPQQRRPPRSAVAVVHGAVCVRDHRGRLLLTRVPRGNPNAGLWEFPSAELGGPRASLADRLARRFGLVVRVRGRRGRIRHAITYRRMTVLLAEAELLGPAPRGSRWRWVAEERASEEALSGQARKLLRLVGRRGAPASPEE